MRTPARPGRTGDRAESPVDDLLDHLTRHTVLNHREAAWVVGEVLAFFNEGVETVIRRRHGELQKQGLANPAIFLKIAYELRWWRVAAPELTERQIRRIIYG